MIDSKETLWISHSAIRNFDNCSRLYYFANIYRNPDTGNRVQIVNPYISLGSAVHEVIDELLDLSPSKRTKTSLLGRLERVWSRYEGKVGGFVSPKQEAEFKKRGVNMIKKVEKSDILSKKALRRDDNLPKMTLYDGIQLVGSFDWIEVLPNNSLHIIDFKTGKSKESSDSLQLPIYQILAKSNYKKEVEKLSYWYLETSSNLTTQKSVDSEKALVKIKKKAIKIKETIDTSNFSCDSPYNRCFWCRKYENIISGKAERVGTNEKMQKDLFYITNSDDVVRKIEESNFLNKDEKKIFRMRMENETLKKVKEDSGKTSKEIKDLILSIKKKIKTNLSPRELKVFVEELSKSDNRLAL